MSANNFAFRYINDEVAYCTLAFVGGYVDAAGYHKLRGLFTSSITGNIVAASTSVVYMEEGVISRAICCIAFSVAAAISAALALRLKFAWELKSRHINVILLSLEAAAFIVTIIIGTIYNDIISMSTSADQWSIVLVGAIMGMSMGFHNVAAKETITNPPCPATTVMTSTLVTVSQNLSNMVTYFLAGYSLPPLKSSNTNLTTYKQSMDVKLTESIPKFLISVKPLVIFVIGAIIGATIAKYIDFYSILIPLVLVLYLMIEILLREIFETNKALASTAATELSSLNHNNV